MAQTWMNPDGLYKKYGVTKTTGTAGGEYVTTGAMREVEFVISDMTTLTETETPLSDVVFLPAGVRIQEIEIVTHTAAATGVAIDLGIIKTDRTTEVDYDGLLAAFPTASMNAAGEKNIITDNTTYDGALVGTTLAFNGYVTCSRTTATAFTAGALRIRIRYYKP